MELGSINTLPDQITTKTYAKESHTVSRIREKARLEIEEEKRLFTDKALQEQRSKIFRGISRRGLEGRVILVDKDSKEPSRRTREVISGILQNGF